MEDDIKRILDHFFPFVLLFSSLTIYLCRPNHLGSNETNCSSPLFPASVDEKLTRKKTSKYTVKQVSLLRSSDSQLAVNTLNVFPTTFLGPSSLYRFT